MRELHLSRCRPSLGDELTELLSQGNLILGSGIAPGGCEVSAPQHLRPIRLAVGGTAEISKRVRVS